MLKAGDVVDIFEDPLTMVRKEGNAEIVEHVVELEPGVNQYKVHFFGDSPDTIVVRTIADEPICTGTNPIDCDDENCKAHGVQAAHWVGVKNRQAMGEQ